MSEQEKFFVTGMYAFISHDEEGESLVVSRLRGQEMTMVVPEGERYSSMYLEALIIVAEYTATKTGQGVELVYFGDKGREHVRWVEPSTDTSNDFFDRIEGLMRGVL